MISDLRIFYFNRETGYHTQVTYNKRGVLMSATFPQLLSEFEVRQKIGVAIK